MRSASLGNLLVLLLASGALQASAQDTGQSPVTAADKEKIEAALKLTKAEAAKYVFVVDEKTGVKRLDEPVLRWSNPADGEVHGNVFLWCDEGQPIAIGSLFKWFSPHRHMTHEFQSLSERRFKVSYDDKEAWSVKGPGVNFAELEGEQPAETALKRTQQLRTFAKGFAATAKDRDGIIDELRLLTQPLHRYERPEQGIIDGAVFAFVQGTDPEVILLLEARRAGKRSYWQFAAARLNAYSELRLSWDGRDVWSSEGSTYERITSHQEPYSVFYFKE